METSKPGQAGIALKWAVICEIISILITVAFQALKVDQNGPAKYINYIPLIIFLVLAQLEYRKQNGGFMRYGEGFVEGLLYGIFTGILGAIFLYIYVSYINPGLLDQAFAAAHQASIDRGATGDQLDQADHITKIILSPPVFAVLGLLATVIFAIIIALITSAITKREPTLADIERQQNDPAV